MSHRTPAQDFLRPRVEKWDCRSDGLSDALLLAAVEVLVSPYDVTQTVDLGIFRSPVILRHQYHLTIHTRPRVIFMLCKSDKRSYIRALRTLTSHNQAHYVVLYNALKASCSQALEQSFIPTIKLSGNQCPHPACGVG